MIEVADVNVVVGEVSNAVVVVGVGANAETNAGEASEGKVVNSDGAGEASGDGTGRCGWGRWTVAAGVANTGCE